jgi:hypothetical protein
VSADLADYSSGFWPYLVLLGLGMLPTAIWRVLAVFVSHGMREGSEVLAWVQAVATTLLAGVVAKLLFTPSGALASVPLLARFGSLAIGLAAFLLLRRSLLAAVLVGEAALIAFAILFARTPP